MQHRGNLSEGSIKLFFKTLTLILVHLYEEYYNIEGRVAGILPGEKGPGVIGL